MSGLRSWLAGTAFLWVALLVAVALSWRRPFRPSAWPERRALVVLGVVAVAIQGAHFGEELLAGFHDRFPRLLGLLPWSRESFVAFNLAWIGIWIAALAGAAKGVRLAEWPVWFLALALVANGVAHPVLSLGRGGYFPGLATSPIAGVAGVLLLRALWRASGGRGT